MRINGGISAEFIERPNRFLLHCRLINGEKHSVHVPDPGRLKELLYPGNRLLVIPAPEDRQRKTRWSLLGAEADGEWILVNTTFHRGIAESLFGKKYSPFGRADILEAEIKSPLGGSRFDFRLNGNLWIEVKGCTLKKSGVAMFPDAPTTRGRKHMLELAELAAQGIPAAVLILVFVRDVKGFAPNAETDPHFTLALNKAIDSGVDVYPVQLDFDGETVRYKGVLETFITP